MEANKEVFIQPKIEIIIINSEDIISTSDNTTERDYLWVACS